MAYWQQIRQKLNARLKDLVQNNIRGFTTGFPEVDFLTGRMEGGQLWMVGGYTGVGKSAFVLNMVEGMLKEINKYSTSKTYNRPKICVFSTELATETYVNRHILLRAGIYKNQLESKLENFRSKYSKVSGEYFAERIANEDSLEIIGGILSFEQIEKEYNSLDYQPNIIIIDYVQELKVANKYELKDTMPILGTKLKEMALKNDAVVIAVSQVTNYSMQSEGQQGQRQMIPFTFGRDMVNAAHSAMLLVRSKENGKFINELQVYVVKARDGQTGVKLFNIGDGYKLEPIIHG